MGWIGKDPIPFDTTTLTLNELTVLGTMGFAWDFPTSLDLLARGRVEAESIITHRFPLDRCLEAILTLHEKKDGVWKAMLVLD
jgi:threonine dehydrogenase-like Zn-dependent dehydrogenase